MALNIGSSDASTNLDKYSQKIWFQSIFGEVHIRIQCCMAIKHYYHLVFLKNVNKFRSHFGVVILEYCYWKKKSTTLEFTGGTESGSQTL
jgi:hypothetical protein